MNELRRLVEWYNLIFILPFLAAAAYTLLLATGHVLDGDGEADGGDDAAGDDVDDHGLEHAVAHEGGEREADAGLGRALGFLGVGKVPLSILLTSFCYIWGVVGWASNRLLAGLLPAPELVIWPSLLLAGAAAVILTRSLALGLARLIPRAETYAVTRQDLLGREGVARYEIGTAFGAANVADRYGRLHQVPCRVRPGAPPIPAGQPVLLAEYDPRADVYLALTLEQYRNEWLGA